ncbi:MAG: heat-inducible transcription repressor HrcA [Firmicutes bacterium]|nr:heat-inducible transcription repressor HrcA [Bacillota bacterium]
MPLSERKKQILRAITHDYINSAEPVGSRTIARRYSLGVSPATIRNEMADLEEDGYLEQPYTSAGRIPSDKGYRFYVDALMDPHKLNEAEIRQVQSTLRGEHSQMGELVHESARLLAFLSQYTALVVAPNLSHGAIRRLQLIPLDEWNVLLVLVIDPGFVQSHIVETTRSLQVEEVARINDFFNRRLFGVMAADISSTLLGEMREEVRDEALMAEALVLLGRGLGSLNKEQVFLDGTIHLFNQPEFKDIDKVKVLLNILDNEKVVWDLLNDTLGNSGIRITIGSENPHEGFQHCSLVTASYELDGHVLGKVGVLGPTRMNYERVVTIVEYIAANLSELLTDAGR